jgi:hypothetical protein
MEKRRRFTLNESEEKEVEVLPAVELEEPLSAELTPELSTEEPSENIPEEIQVSALSMVIGGIISTEWQSLDAINSAIATFTLEKPEEKGPVEVLQLIIEEKTAHVGMLQSIINMLDNKTSELMKDGEEQSQEILEPAVDETKEEESLNEDLLNKVYKVLNTVWDVLTLPNLQPVVARSDEEFIKDKFQAWLAEQNPGTVDNKSFAGAMNIISQGLKKVSTVPELSQLPEIKDPRVTKVVFGKDGLMDNFYKDIADARAKLDNYLKAILSSRKNPPEKSELEVEEKPEQEEEVVEETE